jgi:hypothetical protein
MGGLVLTQSALRFLGQTGKRFGSRGARAFGWLGRHDRLAGDHGVFGSQSTKHQEDVYQGHECELVENEAGYHGNAPEEVVISM